MKSLIYFASIMAAVLLMSACDTYSQDEYATDYVVESYLIAGEPLPEVRLSETAPVDALFEPGKFGVTDANVVVTLMAEDGRPEKSYLYTSAGAGVYLPVNAEPVQASRRYNLQIEVSGQNDPITATTFVPGMLSIMAPETDTLIYQNDEAFALDVSPSVYPGRPAYYVNNIRALDTTYVLTPIYQEFVDEEFVTREELIENSSGIMNEANFIAQPDGSLSMIVPWIGVAYYGPNEVVVSAVDDNLYDFVRSQEGNGVRPFGELENPANHIENGRGIFGSLARSQVEVFVR